MLLMEGLLTCWQNPKFTMETYLAAGRTVLEKYVASIPLGEWPKLMMMTLNRTN